MKEIMHGSRYVKRELGIFLFVNNNMLLTNTEILERISSKCYGSCITDYDTFDIIIRNEYV